MSRFPADLHAGIGYVNSLFEGHASVLSGPTVEVDSLQIHSHGLYLLESLFRLLHRVDVISEFIAEHSS